MAAAGASAVGKGIGASWSLFARGVGSAARVGSGVGRGPRPEPRPCDDDDFDLDAVAGDDTDLVGHHAAGGGGDHGGQSVRHQHLPSSVVSAVFSAASTVSDHACLAPIHIRT